jgi:hypothetical protein
MMNLTIDQVSKLTKLSVPTLYVYASRQKLGKKVGTRKVFSQADVQKLLKGAKKTSPKKTTKAPSKKTSKKAIRTESVRASKPKAAAGKTIRVDTKPTPVSTKPVKASFWSRLFGSGKKQTKVGLMDAKVTK